MWGASQNRSSQSRPPKYDYPYYGDPKKELPIFGKHPMKDVSQVWLQLLDTTADIIRSLAPPSQTPNTPNGQLNFQTSNSFSKREGAISKESPSYLFQPNNMGAAFKEGSQRSLQSYECLVPFFWVLLTTPPSQHYPRKVPL